MKRTNERHEEGQGGEGMRAQAKKKKKSVKGVGKEILSRGSVFGWQNKQREGGLCGTGLPGSRSEGRVW